MRIGWACVMLIACGNSQSQPTTPPPSETATATASATATAPPSATASVAETPSATASATATAPPPAPMKTLAEILANAKSITLTYKPKMDQPDVKQLDIKSAASIKGILDAVGADQHPEGPGPGYMSTFDFKFFDKDGNPLATFSLFASPTMSDSNKKYARINIADGTFGGVTVAKYEDLQKKLKALGVALP